jgi:hypothetical protein
MPGIYSFKTCKNCGVSKRTNGRTYCSVECHKDAQSKERINKWLSGETTGVVGGITTAKWIKRYLIKTRGWKCENCKNEIWMGLPITLEMDHSDGDFTNNRPENLKLLCPNCHSMTPNFKSKNRNGRKTRYK